MLAALANAVGMNLEATRKRFCGDNSFLLECLQGFLQDATFAQLEQAWKEAEQEALTAAAHTLKGLAGNLGLDDLAQASARLMTHLRSEGLAGAAAPYEAVCARYETAITAIKRYNA